LARLPYRDAADLAPEDRDLLVRPVNIYRAMVNAPGITRAFLGLANQIRHESKLDPRLREIAILQVAWSVRSAYEWSHHVKIGRTFGVTESDLRAIASGDDAALDEQPRAIRRAAQAMAEAGDLDDAAMASLRSFLDEERLTELLLICGMYVGLARFLHVARVEVEADYAKELQEYPLPG
jgi:alkylhydroperoxidase family enzyme